MKYYFITADGNEVTLDVSSNEKLNQGIIGFDVNNTVNNIEKNFLVKKVAGFNYISQDGRSWKRLPRISNTSGVVNVTESLKVYRGFKPSGLFSASAGDLVTEMPGKVVKILTAEGAMAQKGDTLLILEAMKMENEIKAGVSGKVKAVHVKEGQIIESGTLMIEIEE